MLAKAEEGKKYDEGKPDLSLLPSQALIEITRVLEHGRDKYGAYNWAKGMNWTRLISAAMRHLFAFKDGEDVDSETGRSHLAHLACCAIFLLEYKLRGVGIDDRYKFGDLPKK